MSEKNLDITGVNVRLYSPEIKEGLSPVILYFPGFAFIDNRAKLQEQNCKNLVVNTGCSVINVSGRCAPENPFPAALEDGFKVLNWVASEQGQDLGLDKDNIILCGFSAGGNLAAVLAHRALKAGINIKLQVLLAAWLDLTMSSPLYKEFNRWCGMDIDFLKWAKKMYLSKLPEGKNDSDTDISPLFRPIEDLRGMARALIMVGEFDPLKDENKKYSENLNAAQVETKFILLEKKIHEIFSAARESLTEGTPLQNPLLEVYEEIKDSIKPLAEKMQGRVFV